MTVPDGLPSKQLPSTEQSLPSLPISVREHEQVLTLGPRSAPPIPSGLVIGEHSPGDDLEHHAGEDPQGDHPGRQLSPMYTGGSEPICEGGSGQAGGGVLVDQGGDEEAEEEGR